MTYRITYAVGQCRTATDHRGTRYHAVDRTVVLYGETHEMTGWDFTPAVCGYVPGRRSNGWAEFQAPAVTCPKCLAKLGKQEALNDNTLLHR